ncbi:MAG: DUF4861 family protein [Paludibacter sp.]|nr:DUF4861 family protein [Paludibacter sp.]
MKKSGIILIASLLPFSGLFAQKSIIVTNNSDFARKAEMVEVKASAIKSCLKKKTYILKNDADKEIPYQLVFDGKKKVQYIIFQADVKAHGSSTYTLTNGKPAKVEPKTFARYVPERKDDFAWENDLAAYRMYGPALASETNSNGVDLWLKSTNKLIINKRYNDDLNNGISYHVDHGEGLDCYKVGATLGAGGIAPYSADKVWTGKHYDKYKTIEVGPLRSTFQLIYDSVVVGDKIYKETITITTDAGSMLNKGVVKYEGAKGDIKLAAGIYLHDGKGSLKENAENGIIAYAENAVSDAGVPAGRNYVGVFIPGKATETMKTEDTTIILADYQIGDTFTYYFGGGWNKWGYPTDADWFKSVSRFAKQINSPLIVTVK